MKSDCRIVQSILFQIEAELKILTNDFEKQVEIVTILLNELDKAHVSWSYFSFDYILQKPDLYLYLFIYRKIINDVYKTSLMPN